MEGPKGAIEATDSSGAVPVEPPSALPSRARPEGAEAPRAASASGVVTRLDRGFPLVRLDSGEEVRCEHATALVKGARVRAVVGDRVEVDVPAGHDKGIIRSIASRRTAFTRRDPAERTVGQVLAANFDLVIIVEPIVQLNVKRLERELVLAHETGARVAVVLTKADLAPGRQAPTSADKAEAVSSAFQPAPLIGDAENADDAEPSASTTPQSEPPIGDATVADGGGPLAFAASQLAPTAGGGTSAAEFVTCQVSAVSDLAGRSVRVLATSLADPVSIQCVRALIPPGQIAILIGKSGVGKSSLVNSLAGLQLQDTAAVRARDGKGRHTTVDRVMVPLPGGGCVVDMPGVRGLGLWDADQGLDAAFADIAALAKRCRFRDCSHDDEPGCAVQAAVSAGEIAVSRLESYRGLAEELAQVRARREESRHRRGEKASDRRRKRTRRGGRPR